ncbi:hypothetical protein ACFQ6N_32095 [Kitasatospora sp. NPDC056446]|uniref:hypothetical protein n=1 Tax=Kitasatospora sp. NPDC056446 TaxID=3345819 RepID=UPI0036B8B737
MLRIHLIQTAAVASLALAAAVAAVGPQAVDTDRRGTTVAAAAPEPQRDSIIRE